MRTEKEMIDLILSTALNDERIRAVIMVGSRANPECPKDKYQDYDIGFYVHDTAPFYDNTEWIETNFGKPSLMQKPESLTTMERDDDGHFTWLMVFPDGNRIDLTIITGVYADDGEPAIVLLDKDGTLPKIQVDEHYFSIKKPSEERYSDVCNEFWWCLNNVVKGIARDEIPYAMEMFNLIVRDMLNNMVNWYIGIHHDFSVSSGKMGKYFKRYLSSDIYEMYLKTYSDASPNNIWSSVYKACDLFHMLAIKVADEFKFSYNYEEENGLRAYIDFVRNDMKRSKNE